MRLTKLLLLLFAVSLPLIQHAQTGYRFRNYSITNGLSQSSVTCIQQDFTYALWVGTQDGLNKFDGYKFEIFTAAETEGLESGYIYCSEKSKDGRLWFGTANGLTVYDPYDESFKTYNLGTSLPLQIEDLFIDEGEKIWAASSTHGIQLFNPEMEKFQGLKRQTALQHVQSLYKLNEQNLLVYSFTEGLFKWNPESNEIKEIFFPGDPENVQISKIIELGNNRVFIASTNGIFQYIENKDTLTSVFPNLYQSFGEVNVTDMYAEEGTWYIASANDGLFTIRNDGSIFNSSQDVFQKYTLLFNEINAIFKDESGTFWIGTQRGLSNFDPSNQGFSGVGPVGNLNQGLPNASVWSLGENPTGEYLFVGTDNALSRYDRKKGKFEHFYRDPDADIRSERNENTILNIYVINANRVLLACLDGLYELQIRSSSDYSFIPLFTPANSDPQFTRMYSIVHYKDKKFFVGTRGGVVLYDLDTRSARIFKHDNRDRRNTIVSGVCRIIYKDKNGKIWFATSGGGLNYLRDDKGELKIVPYERNDILAKFSKDYITSILHRSGSDYWLGTVGSGVLRHNLKNRKTEIYDKTLGLPNNFVYGILPDRDGFLWLSTNRGLCRLSPEKKETQNYTEVDGLMSNEMNLGAYMRGVDGRLYFGGISGFNYFDPRTLSYNKPEVDVVFTKFKLDQGWLRPSAESKILKKSIALVDELQMTHRQRSFTVRFHASDMSNPELIQYKYILEGSEEGEIFLGTDNELHFNSLTYGKYILKVYAKKGIGEWCSQPATLAFEIVPPFWLRWWFFVIVALVLTMLIVIYIRHRLDTERREQVRLEMKIQERTKEIREQNEKIERQKKELEDQTNKVIEQQRLLQIEKDKSEKLLNNIIPKDTVNELKKKGKAAARAYKKVSVMFTDFVGFTKISDSMTPSELVEKLDYFFTEFDAIIEKNNLEKIKTMGDAYMAAGGIPVRNNTNPIESCLAGLQIQEFMRKFNASKQGDHVWNLRLGINTGDVTAGVIGSKRFAYDVWGAAVNMAQRMEMMGEPGKVTITGATYRHIVPYFETTFKGKVQSKSSGLLEMYTVDRIKPELSMHGEGIVPNEKFRKIFDLHMYSSINYYKAERHIMKVLEDGLSDKLYYHCIDHTKDVVRAAESIAIQEGVTDEGLYLLKSAATYHDAGFVEDYDKNEPIGARMAEEILPNYGYTPEQIEIVKQLIYVTEIPHNPTNKLEEIMCDADLDYLGRSDFHMIADRLRRELREHKKINSDRSWDELQVSFLSQHKYFTETAKRNRDAKKAQNLEEIKQRLKEDNYKD